MSRTSLLTAVLASTCALAAAGTAHATTYRVLPENSCAVAQTYAAPQPALNQAAATADADKVLLGAATYTAPSAAGFTYPAASKVEIAGKGAGSVLTAPSGATGVLRIQSAGAGSRSTTCVPSAGRCRSGAMGLESYYDTSYVTANRRGNAVELLPARGDGQRRRPLPRHRHRRLRHRDQRHRRRHRRRGTTISDSEITARNAIAEGANGGSGDRAVELMAGASGSRSELTPWCATA